MPSACLNMREVGFRPDSPGGFGEYLVLNLSSYTRFPMTGPTKWALVETFNVGYWGVWGNECNPDAR